jgi:hypothetical protein
MEQRQAADLVTRLWLLDRRRKSFVDIGETSYPRDIWARIRRRIETDEITNADVPVALPAPLVRMGKRKARAVAQRGKALDEIAMT